MNTRIEKIGDATLYLGDCMDILPTLPKVDAVITDPPYGLNIAAQPFQNQRRNGAEKKDWDESAPSKLLLDEIIQKGEKAILWGGNYFHLPPSRCWLVWHKPDGLPSFSRVELAWTNMDKLAVYFQWTIAATNPERVGHPTQKPLALMKWCIEQAGNPETILDPFMGSGTTGVAAIQMGQKFIGIEKDENYFELACKRIEQAVAQPRLFEDVRPKQEQTSLI
jgi:site-specific DNA-methyltransferase (adenine-specific)/modification methylase